MNPPLKQPALFAPLELGGFMLIEAADRAEALAWAERSPAARRGGAIEVRALDVNPLMPAPAPAL